MSKIRKSPDSDSYNNHFPTVLRELLSRKGETQQKLAEKINVNRQSIGQWKDGITAPDIYALKGISQYYDVSADYLLGLTASPNTDRDVRVVHETTGIADEAIASLLRIKELGFQTTASQIISSESFITLLNILNEIKLQNAQYYESIKQFAVKFQEAANEDALLMLEENSLVANAHLSSHNIKSAESNNIALHITQYINFLRHELNSAFANIINGILGKEKSKSDYELDFIERTIKLVGHKDNEKISILTKYLGDKYFTKIKDKEIRLQQQIENAVAERLMIATIIQELQAEIEHTDNKDSI